MQEFTENLYRELIKHCKNSTIEECAFILKDNSVAWVDNVSDSPDKTFVIKVQDYLKFKKDIRLIFHSHPEGGPPSEEDHIACNRINIPMVICSVTDSIFYFINPKDSTCLQYAYTDI